MNASSVSRNRKVGTQRQTRRARASPTMTPRVSRQQPPRLQAAPAEVTPVARSAALAGSVWGKALMEPALGPRPASVVVRPASVSGCTLDWQSDARLFAQCPGGLPPGRKAPDPRRRRRCACLRGAARAEGECRQPPAAAVAAIRRPAPGRDEGGSPASCDYRPGQRVALFASAWPPRRPAPQPGSAAEPRERRQGAAESREAGESRSASHALAPRRVSNRCWTGNDDVSAGRARHGRVSRPPGRPCCAFGRARGVWRVRDARRGRCGVSRSAPIAKGTRISRSWLERLPTGAPAPSRERDRRLSTPNTPPVDRMRA